MSKISDDFINQIALDLQRIDDAIANGTHTERLKLHPFYFMELKFYKHTTCHQMQKYMWQKLLRL